MPDKPFENKWKTNGDADHAKQAFWKKSQTQIMPNKHFEKKGDTDHAKQAFNNKKKGDADHAKQYFWKKTPDANMQT